MRKIILLLALVAGSMSLLAQKEEMPKDGSSIEMMKEAVPYEVLNNGKVQYDPSTNTLVLEDGFSYGVSKGPVVFSAGRDLHILLKGNAKFKASLVFEDPVIIDSEGDYTLSVTSNISGSAVQCPELTVNKKAKLSLLSRNSQKDMYALSCPVITVNGGTLLAEVTTAPIAVETDLLNMTDCWLAKPKAGKVNRQKRCICFKDGLPAKYVRIIPKTK